MIFVDSSAFVSLRNPEHIFHAKARAIAESLRVSEEMLTTTNIIIAELLTILSMRANKKLALLFGKDVSQQPLQVIYIDALFHQKAWEIFQKITNKDISFFDCTSFAVMKHLGIQKAFSFDKDFAVYGFELLS